MILTQTHSITAEDLSAWMAQHGVNVDDVTVSHISA
jgi:hypothetical protein